MTRRLFLPCVVLLVACPSGSWASHWQPSEQDRQVSLDDSAAIDDVDLEWVLEDRSEERPDAGIDGTEVDPYDALRPPPPTPPAPSAGGGGGSVPITEPGTVWLLGAGWLLLRCRRNRLRA